MKLERRGGGQRGSPKGKPKGNKRERTRARLLAAARELVREVGHERTTLQAVAERAGMTVGAIYGNFKNRDDLFIALAQASWGPVAPAFPEGSSFAEKLQLLAEATIATIPERRDVALGMLSGHAFALTHDEIRARGEALTKNAYEQGEQWVRSVAQPDELAVSPETLVRLIHVLTDGLLLQRFLTPSLVPDELFRVAFSLLAKQCPPPQPAARPLPTPLLRTERTLVRLLTVADAAKALAYFQQSGHRYDPALPKELLSVEHWQHAAERAQQSFAVGTECRLFVFLPDESEIIGTVDLTAIKRELWQHCTLGFAIAAKYERTGVMCEAVGAAIDFAFKELKIHRIEACHAIDNVRSQRLLRRLGFTSVGVIPQYRLAKTSWQDYQLMTLLNPSWGQGPP